MSDGRGLLRRGMVPVRISRVTYMAEGCEPSEDALEIDFGMDGVLLFDVQPDWTISTSSEPWRDPYEGIDTSVAGWDMGCWAKREVSAESELSSLLGRPLSRFYAVLEGFDHFIRLELRFGSTMVLLSSWDLNLTVSVQGPVVPIRAQQSGRSGIARRALVALRLFRAKVLSWRRV